MTAKTRFKQTEIGMIPEPWEVVTFREILGNEGYIRGPFGSALRRPELKTKGIAVYEQEHAIYGSRKFRYYIDEEKFQELSRFAIRENDLIVSCSGTLGKASIISKRDPKGIISQALLILRPDTSKIKPRYLKYFIDSPSGFNSLVSRSTGSVQVNIAKREIIEGIQFALPPLEDQDKITKILFSLDSKIELNQQMNKTLEEIGKAIFKHWFIDFEFPNEEGKPYKSSGGEMVYNEELGKDIPKRWESVRISDICSTQYGYTASATGERVGPRFLRITDMNEQAWIDWSTVPYCRISQNKLENYVLRKGDIVVSRTGASFGRAAIVEEDVDAVFASYLVKLKTQSLSVAYYLFYILRSPSYIEYAQAAAGGSAQPQFNAKSITAAMILLPAPQILEKFLLTIQPLREKIKLDLRESDQLARIRDSILPKLMSGRIRVPVEAR